MVEYVWLLGKKKIKQQQTKNLSKAYLLEWICIL